MVALSFFRGVILFLSGDHTFLIYRKAFLIKIDHLFPKLLTIIKKLNNTQA